MNAGDVSGGNWAAIRLPTLSRRVGAQGVFPANTDNAGAGT